MIIMIIIVFIHSLYFLLRRLSEHFFYNMKLYIKQEIEKETWQERNTAHGINTQHLF